MTGPEHYREAERFTETAVNAPAGSEDEQYALGMAQAHATLALAAATALNGSPVANREQWLDVAS